MLRLNSLKSNILTDKKEILKSIQSINKGNKSLSNTYTGELSDETFTKDNLYMIGISNHISNFLGKDVEVFDEVLFNEDIDVLNSKIKKLKSETGDLEFEIDSGLNIQRDKHRNFVDIKLKSKQLQSDIDNAEYLNKTYGIGGDKLHDLYNSFNALNDTDEAEGEGDGVDVILEQLSKKKNRVNSNVKGLESDLDKLSKQKLIIESTKGAKREDLKTKEGKSKVWSSNYNKLNSLVDDLSSYSNYEKFSNANGAEENLKGLNDLSRKVDGITTYIDDAIKDGRFVAETNITNTSTSTSSSNVSVNVEQAKLSPYLLGGLALGAILLARK